MDGTEAQRGLLAIISLEWIQRPAKDPETCLKVLIKLFCLSIVLQMEARRKTDGYPQELTEFPPKGSSELGTLVQDNIMEQTMQMDDLL